MLCGYQSLWKHFFWTNRWAVEGLRKRSGCFLLPTPCEASTGSQGPGLIPVSHPLAETTDALHQPLWEGGRLLKMLNQKKKIWEVSKIEAVTGHLSMASARKIQNRWSRSLLAISYEFKNSKLYLGEDCGAGLQVARKDKMDGHKLAALALNIYKVRCEQKEGEKLSPGS